MNHCEAQFPRLRIGNKFRPCVVFLMEKRVVNGLGIYTHFDDILSYISSNRFVPSPLKNWRAKTRPAPPSPLGVLVRLWGVGWGYPNTPRETLATLGARCRRAGVPPPRLCRAVPPSHTGGWRIAALCGAALEQSNTLPPRNLCGGRWLLHSQEECEKGAPFRELPLTVRTRSILPSPAKAPWTPFGGVRVIHAVCQHDHCITLGVECQA